jgi:predicted MFS family arabinose efflux permease
MQLIGLDFTSKEWQVTLAAALMMALRMLGLFMLLPVIHHLEYQLSDVTPTKLGLAIGVYGISQALIQLPMGVLSDLFGRKPVLYLGLGLFLAGSLVCWAATTIDWLIVGRAVQGAGAIGAVTLAMVADNTRETMRTKVMAIVGITIGMSFCLSFLLGPLIDAHWGIDGIFIVTALGALGALAIVFHSVPSQPVSAKQKIIQPTQIKKLLCHPQLWRLNVGILCLHAVFTMSFQSIPLQIEQRAHLTGATVWQFYLPVFLVALILMGPFVRIAHRDKAMIKVFFIAMGGLAAALGLISWTTSLGQFYLGMALFFTAFNLLESILPAWTSRVAPSTHKGTAMGLFSTAQFVGIGLGGVLGGALYSSGQETALFSGCVLLMGLWFIIAATGRVQFRNVS